MAVSVAIMLVVSIVVIKFRVNTSEAFTLDGNVVALKQQSERAMEIMAERIRLATTASLALSNGNATLDFLDNIDGSNVQYTLVPLAPAASVWGQIVQTANGTQRVVAGYVEDPSIRHIGHRAGRHHRNVSQGYRANGDRADGADERQRPELAGNNFL